MALRLIFVLLFLFSSPSWAERSGAEKPPSDFYNEVLDEQGNIRPQYRLAYPWISALSGRELDDLIALAKRRMSGDSPIAPLPRILTRSEYDELKRGAEQRARAIQLFLEDHYSGEQRYRDKVIPGEIIDQIIERTGETNYLDVYRKMKKRDRKFRFLYGPDIIRDKEGVFRVLEDNLGFVGGTPGDTIPARETWQGLFPELHAALPIRNSPYDFMTQLMDEMQAIAKPGIGFHEGEGAMVMLASPPYGDKEDVRMAEQFKKRGMILVTPSTKGKKLVVRADGVYLQETTHFGGRVPERKVGLLWLNAEHAWVDWEDPIVREKALLEEARDYLDEKGKELKRPRVGPDDRRITHKDGTKEKTKEIISAALEPDPRTGRISVPKLEAAIAWAQKNDFTWVPSSLTSRSPVPGLLRAILDGKVESNYTPGAEFVGDKMFHSYMEDLIRFYLNEEPILKNPKTERFFYQNKKGRLVFDREALDKAMGKKNKRVIKVVDGRGGEGIHIGPKLTMEEWRALDPVVREEYLRYVSQKYLHPSIVEDGHNRFIADIRMFTYVSENGPLVSGTPWSRLTMITHDGVPVHDSGKVNMSQGTGVLAVVLVVPDCEEAMKKMARKNR